MTTSVLVKNQNSYNSTSVVTQNKTYLQQCVDDLNPSNISSWEQKATQYHVAAIATHVAFTVLSVIVVAIVAVFAPIYVPFITIGGAFVLKEVQKTHDQFEQFSKYAQERSEQLKEISRQYQALSNTTLLQLQNILQQRGIFWFMIPGMLQNPGNLTSLIPLIARHNFWEEHLQNIEMKKQDVLVEAGKMDNEGNHQEEVHDLRCEALEIEKMALEAKIKNSFINAVIRRPNYVGTLDDLGTFSILSGQERAIGNAVAAPCINHFFSFKSNEAPITVDEVKKMKISDLAMRMLKAMPS